MAEPLRRRPAGRARGGPVPARRPRFRTTLLLVVVLAALGLTSWSMSFTTGAATGATTFEVFAHGENEVAYARELVVGERFRLEHTHSVTRRPVIETFSVQSDATIAIEQLWFDEPGPNLPAGSEPLGDGRTTFLQEDGAFRVLHHGYPIGSLPLMVGGPGVDHTLVFADDERVRLLDVVRRGERVELMVGGTSSGGAGDE